LSFSQNPTFPEEECLLLLKNKKPIKRIQLWEVYPNKLEYFKEGSLHDMPLEDIDKIKTDDEIVSFDVNNEMVIKPYDLIITGKDTIRCTITQVTVSTIYYYKKKGHHKLGYVSRYRKTNYIRMNETQTFSEFSDDYYTEILKARDKKIPEDNFEYESSTELMKEKKVVTVMNVPTLSTHENAKKTAVYQDLHGNNDLIITKSGQQIVCTITKVSQTVVYFVILRRGPDKRGRILLSSVKDYYDNTKKLENSDKIMLSNGDTFSCKIKNIKNGRIYYSIYKSGPDTRSSIPLKYVKKYERKGLKDLSDVHKDTNIPKVNPHINTGKPNVTGRVIGQYFAGAGVGLALGIAGTVAGQFYRNGEGKMGASSDYLPWSGLALGEILGSTLMVCVIGNSAGNKGNILATAMGAAAGTLLSAALMSQIVDATETEMIIGGSLLSAALPSLGAVIGYNTTVKAKQANRLSFNVKPNGMALAYNF